MLGDIATVRGSLREHGFVRLDLTDFERSRNLRPAFEELQAAWLPPDRDHPTGRCRRYGRFGLFSKSRVLWPYPPEEWDTTEGAYFEIFPQPLAFNPTDGGKRRIFAPLMEIFFANPFLREVILYIFDQTPLADWPGQQIWQVGLHLIALCATAGTPAFSSPDCLHRDGEPVTAAILIRRDAGVIGGANWIGTPQCVGRRPDEVAPEDILAQFVLERPLQGYIVIDRLVSHYVEPVALEPGYEQGSRVVLLVDFTPMKASLDPA